MGRKAQSVGLTLSRGVRLSGPASAGQPRNEAVVGCARREQQRIVEAQVMAGPVREHHREREAGPHAGMIVHGEAASEIVRVAKERGVDLIVVSSHGRTGLGRILFGSTAEAVVRHASCPVLVVKPPPEEESQ